MESRSAPPVLVVDPDPVFLASIEAHPDAAASRPRVARTAAEADALLANPASRFRGIFVNPRVSGNGGIAVIRRAIERHFGTPIVVIYDGEEPPFSPEELSRITVHEALPKPISYARMLEIVKPIVPHFEGGGPGDAVPLDQEISAEDAEFVPIRARTFLSGKTSFFDVYVRLSSGRYVKLLNAGEEFLPDRLIAYVNKGIENLYLRREAHESYVRYCDQLAAALVRQPSIPLEIRAAQTLTLGEEILKIFTDRGVEARRISFAADFARHARQVVSGLPSEKHAALRMFLDDVIAYEHGVATAVVAGMLVQSLKIESERVHEMVGMGALLHDIGLHQLAPCARHEDEAMMTAEQRTAYRLHPMVGAKTLDQVRGVPTAVIQGVAQHHERRDGHGFPGRIGAGKISAIGEIVGISDEFVRAYLTAKTRADSCPLEQMSRGVLNQFSCGLADAFCALFLR